MVGRADRLEALRRHDAARVEQEGHGRQGARGRLGVADAEIVLLAAGQNLVQRDARALLDDQGRLVAVQTFAVDRAGDDLGVGAVDGLDLGLGREPAHLGVVAAHGLDQNRVVRAEVGLHRHADRLGHVVQQRLPQRARRGLALGRQDGEGDFGRGGARRLVFALAAGGEAQGQGGDGGDAHEAAGDGGAGHALASQNASSYSGP
ncbi:hypothetical protein D3C80_1324760 [compost metagenome]